MKAMSMDTTKTMKDYQLPSARSDAKHVGAKYYFTGRPCKRGHIAPRSTTDGVCTICKREWKQTNKEKVYKYNKPFRKRYYAKNQTQIRQKVIQWNADHPEQKRQQSANWRKTNPKLTNEINKRWLHNNPQKVAQYRIKRRNTIQQATVKWADQQAIKKLYSQAKQLTEKTGVEYEVDHIVPLTSNFVCGLHCEDNLQVLTKSENASKSNKLS